MGGKKKVSRSDDSVDLCLCRCGQVPNREGAECPRCERNRKSWRSLLDYLRSKDEDSFLLNSGTLVWCIQERFITGDITRRESGSFLTSQYGYMLCVELVAFNNSLGDRRILLRPIILSGPYNAVNQWPFKETITFKFINRSNPHENKVLIFRTDQEGIQRPQNGMKVASSAGVECLDICQLIRDGFIEDGNLIIVCECHTSDIPRQTRKTLPTSCDVSTLRE